MAYPISRWVIPPIYKLWLGKADGIGNIPKDKPFIIAANHASYYDALLIPCIIVPRIKGKMHALVNSSYWKNRFTGFFLDLWECVPVYVNSEKNSKDKNKAAFEKALSYLEKNEPVMIFPEGHRSPDGRLQKAYTGVARLALKAKVPVLPVGIIGSSNVLPKGKIFPRFERCEVNIGRLMHFDKDYSKKIDNRVLENATRSIMRQIAKLIGQEYSY